MLFFQYFAVFLVLLTANTCYSQNIRFGTDGHLLLVGDSFTNDGTLDWAGKVNVAADFELSFVSVAGRSLNQINDRFPDLYEADTYDAIVIAAGVNELSSNRTFPEIQGFLLDIIEQTNGEHIIVTTIPPFRGLTAFFRESRQNTTDTYNDWIRTYAASTDGISLFDIGAFLDQDGDDFIDDQFGSFDGLHPRNCPLGQVCGMSLIADEFISQFEATLLLGDVNSDLEINFLDISPFISILSSGEFQPEADINHDMKVNFLDISPFIEILSGSDS